MPRVDTTVLDALLNEVDDNGVEIYICETRPTSRATAVSNALHVAAVVRTIGKVISGAAGLTQDGGDRRYTDGPYAGVTLDNITGTQTPTFVAVCTNAGGDRLLLVADTTGATAVANDTVIDLGSWDHIVNGPV